MSNLEKYLQEMEEREKCRCKSSFCEALHGYTRKQVERIVKEAVKMTLEAVKLEKIDSINSPNLAICYGIAILELEAKKKALMGEEENG